MNRVEVGYGGVGPARAAEGHREGADEGPAQPSVGILAKVRMLRDTGRHGGVGELEQEGGGRPGKDHHLAVDAPTNRPRPKEPRVVRTVAGARRTRTRPESHANLGRRVGRQSSCSSITSPGWITAPTRISARSPPWPES